MCAWAQVSAVPPIPGWGVGLCVLVCALRLYPTNPGWAVRCGCVLLGADFGCAPPILAGVMGSVCICVRAPPVPHLSWLGCAGQLCVPGLGFRLCPAISGLGVRMFVCLCARSPCTPTILAGVRGVTVCAWARVSSAPRHFWIWCWGVCVGVHPLPVPRHYCLGCWAVCVCLCARFSCTQRIPARVCGVCVCAWARVSAPPRYSLLGFWVCVSSCTICLYPAIPGWGAGPCVCLCGRSSCAPPPLTGMCCVGVCAWARVSEQRRDSWLRCAVWVCVFLCALRLYPAGPGWGVRCGCLCLGSGLGCAPPFLAELLGCVCRCAPLVVPCHSMLGSVSCGSGGAWHLFPCRGSLRVVCAARVCGTRWPQLLGTSPRVMVVPCGVPLWHASRPRVGAPRPVRSGCCHAPVGFPDPVVPFPTRRLAPPDLLGGCAGHVEASREPGALCLLLAAAEAAALGLLHNVHVRGPAMGLSLAGPSRIGPGLRALRWLGCVDPVTDASGFPYRPSFDGGLGRCTGAASCGRPHHLLWGRGCHARVPCVCARVCPSWLGRAGRPPGRVLVRLTFCSGRSPCSLCLLHPLWAGVTLLVVVAVFFLPFCGPPPSLAFLVFRPGVPWALATCGPPPFSPPPSLFFSRAFLLFFVCLVSFPCRGVPVVRCRGGLCVLGCGVCWWVLLRALGPGKGLFALALFGSVLPGCAYSRCVVTCRVARVPWCPAGDVCLPRAASGALLACFVRSSCSAAHAACRRP